MRRRFPSPSATALGIVMLFTACQAPLPAVAIRDARTPTTTFSSVRADGPTHVFITVGLPHAVEVNCDESSTKQRVRTHVENATLVIASEWEGAKLWPVRACTVNVALPALAAIDARGEGNVGVAGWADGLANVTSEGSGEVSIQGVRTQSLVVVASGGGAVKLGRLEATDVSADVRGGGPLRIAAGKAKALRLRVAGGSVVEGRDFAVERADVDTTGTGDLELRVTERAQVKSSGSGDVRVLGHPKEKNAQRAGTGEVRFE